MTELHPGYRPITLCEVCARAAGLCHWSQKDNMRPVPGWDAIRKDVRMQTTKGATQRFIESYIVLSCPLFELEEHNRWAYERFEPDRVRDKGGERCGGNKFHHRKVRCLDTDVVYSSAREAARALGLNAQSVRAACMGAVRAAKGLRWEYVEEETK